MKRKFFFAACLLAASGCCSAFAQKVTFHFQDAKLETVFNEITRQTGLSVAYSRPMVNPNELVSVTAKDEDISSVLSRLFKGKDIVYEIEKQNVFLRKRVNGSDTSSVSRKNIAVKGRVVDQNGEPVIGANIIVKGTSNGAVTDLEGNYQLSDVADNAMLEFSYLGYQSLILKATDNRVAYVVMHEDVETIEEVVVVGYGVQKKANLTGAVSSINMDEILGNRPVSTVSNVLMGAMPGLQVTGTSGRPGGDLSFNIRGVNSINEGAPLVLVDNVEMDLNMLDPNDIESVSVLKDAASSAIYGARAAFGVILVTTKKGAQESHFSINYSNNFSFSQPTNLPHKATPLQTVQAYKDMGIVSYQTGQDVDTWLGLLKEYAATPQNYSKGYAEVDGLRYSLAENDLFQDMTETGFQQTHNVAVNGGSKTISYRMAMGYIRQDGVLVTEKDSYKRCNVSSYIRSDLYSWITPELDIKYAKSESQMPFTTASYGIWGAAVAFPSYFPLGDMDLNGEVLPVNTPRNFIMLSYPKQDQRDDLRILGKVTLTPFKGLKIIGEYTYNKKMRDITEFDKKFDYAHGANFRKEQSVSNSKYEVNNRETDYTAVNVYANYLTSWGRHDLHVMAGFNQESNSYYQLKALRTDMINEELPSLSQATGDYRNSDSFEEYHVRGLFYRLNYTYAGKYLLETNGRYDGSSKFPTNNRFGFFPSVSVGWRLSEEMFMDWSDSFLSNWKFRASYGNIGNQSIRPYAFIPGMESGLANWVVNGSAVTTLKVPSLVSNSFTWEKVSTFDVGVDMGLFNNRLNMVFDWYSRDTKGMLAPGMELPGVLGASAPLQNAADLRSNGWELSVDWNDRIGNFQYYLGLNLYDSTTKITKYDNEVGLLGKDSQGKTIYRKGMKLGEIWGYETDRLYTVNDFDESGNLKNGLPRVEGYNPRPGDVLYKDLDGNCLINNGNNTESDSGDLRVIGNNTRRFQYGVRGGMSWKDLSFSFVLQGVGKRDLWMMNELAYPFYDAYSTLYDSQLDYWTPENTDSHFPRLYEKSEGNTKANQLTQTHYLHNGAYLSIRNVSLSYMLPKKWLMPWGVKNLSVFISGENLFTFDHLPKGMDAERVVTDELGQRGFTYPYMVQYSFGINLTF